MKSINRLIANKIIVKVMSSYGYAAQSGWHKITESAYEELSRDLIELVTENMDLLL